MLEPLGAKIDLAPDRVARSIEEIGIGFMFAPAMHAATRHAMPVRRELRMRTVFNLLGPLTNPAGASVQIVGVYEASLTELVARALGELGVRRAFVVHGADGLDEISISGETYISELRDRSVRNFTVTPEDFGLRRWPLKRFAGGDAKHNAEIILQTFWPFIAPPCEWSAPRNRAGQFRCGARRGRACHGFYRRRARGGRIDRLRRRARKARRIYRVHPGEIATGRSQDPNEAAAIAIKSASGYAPHIRNTPAQKSRTPRLPFRAGVGCRAQSTCSEADPPAK